MIGKARHFKKDDLDFIFTLALQVSALIEKTKLYEDISHSYKALDESYLLTIEVLSQAIDAKDHYTRGHSDRVTKYCLLMAEDMGFLDEERDIIYKAGMVHDVGKIGLSETILNKSGKLTEEEFKQVKMHPVKGAEIIGPIGALSKVRSIIYHHHERFDGYGYPDGIKGYDIPLESRMMAIADSFDAMTSNRPYRKSLAKETAIEEIKRCAGSQFDPDFVDVFLKVSKGMDIILHI